MVKSQNNHDLPIQNKKYKSAEKVWCIYLSHLPHCGWDWTGEEEKERAEINERQKIDWMILKFHEFKWFMHDEWRWYWCLENFETYAL